MKRNDKQAVSTLHRTKNNTLLYFGLEYNEYVYVTSTTHTIRMLLYDNMVRHKVNMNSMHILFCKPVDSRTRSMNPIKITMG